MKVFLKEDSDVQKKFVNKFIKNAEYVADEKDADLVLMGGIYPIVPINHKRQPTGYFSSTKLSWLFLGVESYMYQFSTDGYCISLLRNNEKLLNNFIDNYDNRVNIYYSYFYLFMVWRFLKEKVRHMFYGAPLRKPDEILERFNTCNGCDFFEKFSESTGQCSICGCGIKAGGNNMNKLAWKTTICPHNPPKWF